MKTSNQTLALQATGFALYQSGHAIFGVGSTKEAAIQDAIEWMDGDTVESVGERLAESANTNVDGGLYCQPCTAALMAEVKSETWGNDWGEVGGVLCTVTEEAQFNS